MKTKLTGRARNMIKYRTFDNFEQLCDHLEDIFSEKRSVAHWQLELNSTHQAKGEEVGSYTNKIETYLLKLDRCDDCW